MAPSESSPDAATVDAAPAARGRRRDPERDEAIRDACIELIAAEGYDRVTIERVAARAGASKATVYRRWPSKAALAIDALLSRKRPVEPIDTGSLSGDLAALANAYCTPGSEATAVLMRGIASAMARDAELLAAFQAEFAAPRRERIEGILTRARDRGELPADLEIGVLAEVMPSMLLQRLLLTGAPAEASYVRSIIHQVLMPMLGVRPDAISTTTPPEGPNHD